MKDFILLISLIFSINVYAQNSFYEVQKEISIFDTLVPDEIIYYDGSNYKKHDQLHEKRRLYEKENLKIEKDSDAEVIVEFLGIDPGYFEEWLPRDQSVIKFNFSICFDYKHDFFAEPCDRSDFDQNFSISVPVNASFPYVAPQLFRFKVSDLFKYIKKSDSYLAEHEYPEVRLLGSVDGIGRFSNIDFGGSSLFKINTNDKSIIYYKRILSKINENQERSMLGAFPVFYPTYGGKVYIKVRVVNID